MAKFEGLRIHSFLIWALGLLPFDYSNDKKGIPLFTSWFGWWTLRGGVIGGIQLVTFLDLVQSSYSVVDSLDSSTLAVYLNTFILSIGLASNVSFRLLLLFNAKGYSNLFCRIRDLESSRNNGALQKSWRKPLTLLKIFGVVSFGLVAVQSVFFGFTITERSKSRNDRNDSWFAVLGVFSPVPIFFMYITAVSLRSIVFMIVSFVAFNVTRIYEDFCIQLEKSLSGNKGTGERQHDEGLPEDIEDALRKLPLFNVTVLDADLTRKWATLGGGDKGNNKLSVYTSEQPSDDADNFLQKLEKLESLFKETTRLLSPLVLLQVVTTVLVLVTDSYLAIVGGIRESSQMAVCLLSIVESLIYTGIVFVGQEVEDRFADRQMRLKKAVVLCSSGGNDTKKGIHQQLVVEVASLAMNLDWKLSACGIFFVDRRLLSGIVSTAMSYIVILIQFQLADRSFPLQNAIMK